MITDYQTPQPTRRISGTLKLVRGNRYSQIAMPWDADQTFFRSKQDNTFSNWLEVVRGGNANAFTTRIQRQLNQQDANITNIATIRDNLSGYMSDQ